MYAKGSIQNWSVTLHSFTVSFSDFLPKDVVWKREKQELHNEA